MHPQILPTVRGSCRKIYTPGMEKELADAVEQTTLDQLKADGHLTGDWRSFQTAESFLSQEETARRLEAGDESDIVMDSFKYWNRQRVAGRKAEEAGEKTQTDPAKTAEGGKAKSKTKAADKPTETGLPKDFPGEAKFTELGFKTVEEVHALSKEQLTALEGIDEETAEKALAFGK